MAVRSKRLAFLRPSATSAQTLYVAPSGETVLIKQLTVYARATGGWRLDIQVNSAGTAQEVMSRTQVAGASVEITLFVVLQPNDKVLFTQDTANAFTIGIYGAELEGVAD